MSTSNNKITPRRHDLDKLRAYLTGLVIVHHTAIPYGGSGYWSFKSACFRGSSPLLIGFNGYNQSFFMGLFFWISGRVSAQSLALAPSRWVFVRSKLIRLGIPTLLYSAIIYPASRVLALPEWNSRTVVKCLEQEWHAFDGVRGPVWYTATLLLFDICAAVITKARHSLSSGRKKSIWVDYNFLSRWGWLAIAGASFLIRTKKPVVGPDRIPIIGGRAGYISQYIYAYVLGHSAFYQEESRMKDPFESSSVKTVTKAPRNADPREVSQEPSFSLTTATAISIGTLMLCSTPVLYTAKPSEVVNSINQLLGGWNFPSLLYALWNEFSFVIVGPALTSVFQRRYGKLTAGKLLSPQYSYAAFLVHTPVSIAIELLVESFLCPKGVPRAWMGSVAWKICGPLFMTAAIGTTNVLASFLTGRWLIDHVPGLGNLL